MSERWQVWRAPGIACVKLDFAEIELEILTHSKENENSTERSVQLV